MQRFDHDTVLFEKALDQQDRLDRDENVFAEEHRDIVDRRRVRANLLAHRVGQFAVAVRGGAYRGGRVYGGRVWRGGRWVYTGGCTYSLWVSGLCY